MSLEVLDDIFIQEINNFNFQQIRYFISQILDKFYMKFTEVLQKILKSTLTSEIFGKIFLKLSQKFPKFT